MSPNGQKGTKSVLKQQCFACYNTVPRTHYKNKYIFYNHRKVKLCVTCSKDQSRLKTKSAIEYIECTICDKSVNYESILCNLCQSWVHPDCAGLNKRDLSTIGEESYGDWYCPPCKSNIFPFQTNGTLDKSTIQLTNEFKTYTDCSSCNKQVKGQSLCCGLCNHWVDKKCIGKFSNSRKRLGNMTEFEYMNDFYKNKDWFCPNCTGSIFPFCTLGEEDF